MAIFPVTLRLMRDSYAAGAYYEPNASRSNLFLLTEAMAAKIEFQRGNSGEVTATGVTFQANGERHTAKANKEVIVSGGAINSPQILELSGIGSPTVLQKAGIEVLVDNPNVGENLNDHTATGIGLVCQPPFLPCAAAYHILDRKSVV